MKGKDSMLLPFYTFFSLSPRTLVRWCPSEKQPNNQQMMSITSDRICSRLCRDDPRIGTEKAQPVCAPQVQGHKAPPREASRNDALIAWVRSREPSHDNKRRS
jgi:hypothetical protein